MLAILRAPKQNLSECFRLILLNDAESRKAIRNPVSTTKQGFLFARYFIEKTPIEKEKLNDRCTETRRQGSKS